MHLAPPLVEIPPFVNGISLRRVDEGDIFVDILDRRQAVIATRTNPSDETIPLSTDAWYVRLAGPATIKWNVVKPA